MTPERWLRVKELFHAALERNTHDRPAFLAAACGEDAALRAEVDSLLHAHQESWSVAEGAPMGRDAVAAGKMRLSLTGLVIRALRGGASHRCGRYERSTPREISSSAETSR